MQSAAVPIAPVDEHSDPGAWKYEIGFTVKARNRSPVHEVAESRSMQDAAKPPLWLRIAPSLPLHPRAHRGGRWPRTANPAELELHQAVRTSLLAIRQTADFKAQR